MQNDTCAGLFRPVRPAHQAKLWAAALILCAATIFTALAGPVQAQNYRFSSVRIEGNERIEAGTILSYAGIARGQSVSAGDINDAYQRILGSGLFESVVIEPRGATLFISVRERPTINRISIEGNRRLKDEEIQELIKSRSRQVYSPAVAESDAQLIAEAYSQSGRVAARVTPRIIRRSEGRVDLVFEIFEGGNVEIERVGFVGNRNFSDYRLRRVVQSKQAGLLRQIIRRDTFNEDRVLFDQQVLRDFYLSRGYVDFRVTATNAELTRERDGYFITFNIEEGQQFRFGRITTTSQVPEAVASEFQAALRIKPGVIYTPTLVENSIARMERLAIQKGINFLRVEPKITRDERNLALDIEFQLTRGPRVFVERIDIEGNTTTLDQVIRRQFRIVEGDPFNPREVRESAERIRALGFFEDVDVQAREGTRPDQVVVDVDVQETTTGSLSLGGTYSTNSGFGVAASFREENFLGRGQKLAFTFSGAESNRQYTIDFTEPAFLGRDVAFDFAIGYIESETDYSTYDSEVAFFETGLTFPLAERSKLNLNYHIDWTNISIPSNSNPGGVITADAAIGDEITSYLGYVYTYDTRINSLNPNAGALFSFGQDFAGVGGDQKYIKTSAKMIAQTRVFNEEIVLRATLQGGAINNLGGNRTRVTDRYLLNSNIMRGFEPGGIGPREIDIATNGRTTSDSLGGKFFAVAQFEAEFPLGLPEEYNIRGGAFYDLGTVWDTDGVGDIAAGNALVQNSASVRHVVGVSLLWDTPIGPLRFNWSNALKKEAYDREQKFDLTISTNF